MKKKNMTTSIITKRITTTGMTERLLFMNHMRTRTGTCPSPMTTRTYLNCIIDMIIRNLEARAVCVS